MPENNLINLGDIAKPIDTLINKISDAIGVLYEPTHMKRKAKAEIEIVKMNSLAKFDLNDIENRAMKRLLHKETQKQENIESIIEQAVTNLQNDAEPEKLERDWLTIFFDKAENCSDQEMRTLWSKILSREANQHGSFSRKTLEVIATISKEDAHSFTKVCECVWMVGNYPQPFILDTDLFPKQHQLVHLETMGLIRYESMGLSYDIDNNQYFHMTYFGKQLVIELPNKEKNKLPCGSVNFTRAGRELFHISGAQANEEIYLDVVKEYLTCRINAGFLGLYSDAINANLTLFSPYNR